MHNWATSWSHSWLAVGAWLMCFTLLLGACGVGQTSPELPLPAAPPAMTVPPLVSGAAPILDRPPPLEPTVPGPTDTGWIAAATGVEYRAITTSLNGELVPLNLMRFDPTQVLFQVGYAPQAPRWLADWCGQRGVLAAINGGFFDQAYHSTALVIQQGVASGHSYEGQGGMFAIDVSGVLSLRHLADQPYAPEEPLLEAMQGWPMLIKGGSVAYTAATDQERARRSALGMDTAGRVLFIVAPTSHFTLPELAMWLHLSDLELDAAVNLDGGSSTGFCIRTDGVTTKADAYVPLPLMLLVTAR